MESDFYEILGVDRDADDEEIKSAYKRLVRTTHPDAGGNQALFVLVQQAYEVLSDSGRRAEYDAGETRIQESDSCQQEDNFDGWEEVDVDVVEEPRPRRAARRVPQSKALPLPIAVLLGAVVVGIAGWLASGVDHWLAWQVDQGVPHAIGMIHGPVPVLPGPSYGVIFWSVVGGGVGALINEKVVGQLDSRRRVHTVELGVLALYGLWQTVIAAAAWVAVIGLVAVLVRFGGRRRQIEAHQ